MSYTVQFSQVTPYMGYLAGGACLSLQMAAISFFAGGTVGLACASVLEYGPAWARWPVKAYVVFFLNTPLLVQIFFFYFALPDVGIMLGSEQAVLVGMSLNAGSYLTEIMRTGFRVLRRSELEAAETLGFTRLQTIRHVIWPHICKVLFLPLSNQYIILTLTTSIAAIFGVEELTGRAYNVNSQTFRSLEVFSIAALYYVGLTFVASIMLYMVGYHVFGIRRKVF